jgi:UDP-glucuronate decarboxylase
MPEDDTKQRQPDITQAREILGWEPTVQLEKSLGQTIKYFEKQI